MTCLLEETYVESWEMPLGDCSTGHSIGDGFTKSLAFLCCLQLQLCRWETEDGLRLTQSAKPLFSEPQNDNPVTYPIPLLSYISYSWLYLHSNHEYLHNLEDKFLCLSTCLRVKFINISLSEHDSFQHTFEVPSWWIMQFQKSNCPLSNPYYAACHLCINLNKLASARPSRFLHLYNEDRNIRILSGLEWIMYEK